MIQRSRRFMMEIPALTLLCLMSTAAAAGAAATAADAQAETERPPSEVDESAAGWTPELCMRFRPVTGTALSPDGGSVAFVVRQALMEGKQSEYRSHIWMADGETPPYPFTRGEASATSPAFSPDGRWLAFGSDRKAPDQKEERRQVWVIRTGGGEAWPATRAGGGVGSFRWSPTGDRIAFIMADPETKAEKKEKEEKRDVILMDRDFDYGHLYVVRFDPEASEIPTAVRLTAGDFHVTSFDWAPDGDRLVFAHQPDPRLNTGFISGDISLVTVPGPEDLRVHEAEQEDRDDAAAGSDGVESADGAAAAGDSGSGEAGVEEAPPAAVGVVTPLVAWGGSESDPVWSPDGKWIAFAGSGRQPERIGLDDLYVVPAAGGEPRRLAETPDRRVGVLAWAADSSRVYVQESIGSTRHVLSVPLSGGEARQVSEGEGVAGAVSLSRDGSTMAFTWQTPDTPWDVHVSPTRRFAPERVSDLHRDIDLPEMGRTRVLRWQAPDGTEVEGLLTTPVGYRDGERVPVILNVHGGPAGVFSQTFTGGPSIYMVQVFAQQGYAVLRPNPRGSTGYGKEFRYANFKDWGYGDLGDLLAGLDLVLEKGIGDPERQFLMGWSYGGYMTSFAVTRTDRFKAASMGAGLPNLVSMVTTTDIGDYLVGHMGAEVWEDYATYEKHSAIYRIAEVSTPTQVLHGQNDVRVPFDQGLEFYRALQRRGVPTEMVVYPRTPHGPREPKLLMDVTPRILKWFEAHTPAP